MDKKMKVWLYVLLFLLIASLIMCVIFKLTLDDVNAKYMALLSGDDAVSATTIATDVTPGTASEDPTQEPADPTAEPMLAGYTEAQVTAMADELSAANARIAELEGCEAELETAEARIAELEGEVTSLESRVAELESAAQTAGDNTQAEEELTAAKAELDTAKAELDAAKAELDTAKAELDAAKAELDTAKAELDVAKAELETAEAQRDEALAALDGANAEIASLEGELDMYRGDSGAGSEFGDVVRVRGTDGEFEFTNSSAVTVVCRLTIDGEELFVSGEIAPGETVTGFTAAYELAPGSYEAMFTVESMRDDGSIASRMTVPVTVTAE